MKTKGKDLELVKIIDTYDSWANDIFPVAVNINIRWNNTIPTFFEVKQENFKVEHQSKVTQFKGHEWELMKEVLGSKTLHI